MSENSVALARQLIDMPEILLGDSSESETLDLVLACALAEYEPGNRYLYALNARRLAARSGQTIELMRWSVAARHARAVISTHASANAVSFNESTSWVA